MAHKGEKSPMGDKLENIARYLLDTMDAASPVSAALKETADAKKGLPDKVSMSLLHAESYFEAVIMVNPEQRAVIPAGATSAQDHDRQLIREEFEKLSSRSPQSRSGDCLREVLRDYFD